MKDKAPSTCVMDLEKARNRRQVTRVLQNLLEEARNGTLKCAAIRAYYKDGTSEVKLIGGTSDEQAEALAKLEAEEAKGKALMEELRPDSG